MSEIVGDGDASLDDFFTNRDYSVHDMKFGDLSIKVKFLDAGSTDYDLTGQIPWPASSILANFVVSETGRSLLSGKHCLEMGSGAGITGLLGAQVCRSIVFTDHNDFILDLLRENIALNSARFETAPQVAKLEWGRAPPPADAAVLRASSFDAVIGSDIVYAFSAVDPVIATLDTYLSHSPGAVAVVAYLLRWSNLDRAWLAALAASPFDVVEVPLDSFMSSEDAPAGGSLFVLRRKAHDG